MKVRSGCLSCMLLVSWHRHVLDLWRAPVGAAGALRVLDTRVHTAAAVHASCYSRPQPADPSPRALPCHHPLQPTNLKRVAALEPLGPIPVAIAVAQGNTALAQKLSDGLLQVCNNAAQCGWIGWEEEAAARGCPSLLDAACICFTASCAAACKSPPSALALTHHACSCSGTAAAPRCKSWSRSGLARSACSPTRLWRSWWKP